MRVLKDIVKYVPAPNERMEVTELSLFYRYAIPCGELGVELGVLDEEKVAEARKRFFSGDLLENPEEVFPVAMKLLKITADRISKKEIDGKVIRKYFWDFHDEHVREDALIIPGFPVKECMVWPGEMVETDFALTPIGKKRIKKDLVDKISVGDFVTVHHGYVCEKISEEEFKAFWRRVENERKD